MYTHTNYLVSTMSGLSKDPIIMIAMGSAMEHEVYDT